MQNLLTFVAAVSFAIPTLSRAVHPYISLRSGWFVAAIALAAGVTLFGLVARLRGSLTLPSPETMYQKSLGLSVWEFQRDALYFAGKHYEANRTAVNAKATASAIMGGLLVCEMALFFIWASHA
jgi:hypothetical protein